LRLEGTETPGRGTAPLIDAVAVAVPGPNAAHEPGEGISISSRNGAIRVSTLGCDLGLI
jgi:hypothetical protein